MDMMPIDRKFPVMMAPAVVLVAILAYGLGARSARTDATHAIVAPESVEPLPKELAPYMGELQRLTHKLALSLAAENAPLANFYLYESVEQLRAIQEELPAYENLPVALLIDRLSLPRYDDLKAALATVPEDARWPQARMAFTELVRSCNDCHAATQHAFLKITPGFATNPFNQDFQP